MGLEMPTDEFTDALELYSEATGKDMAESMNRAGGNLALRAAGNTPFVARSTISQELTSNPKLLAALTHLHLQKEDRKVTKREFKQEEMLLLQHRRNSSKFLRAGWAQAVIDMGRTFRGSRLQKTAGYGRRATAVDLLAEIAWAVQEPNSHKADKAELIAEPAFLEAFEFVVNDIRTYAQDKLDKQARKFSA